MGLIPTATSIGNDVLLCFAAGKTPSAVKCFFGGIERGALWQPAHGMPPNGYFDLFNAPAQPSIWTHGAPPWPQIIFGLDPGNSVLRCKPSFLRTAFSGHVFDDCIFHFTNLLQGAAGNFFYGGFGSIAVTGAKSGGGVSPPLNLANVVTDITPMIDPDPRLECFPSSADHVSIRYAGKRDATNIMIKFDTTA